MDTLALEVLSTVGSVAKFPNPVQRGYSRFRALAASQDDCSGQGGEITLFPPIMKRRNTPMTGTGARTVRKIVLLTVTAALFVSFFLWRDDRKRESPSAEEPALTGSDHFETEFFPRLNAAGNGRPLLVFITDPDCPFCGRMWEETFRDREIIQLCGLFTCVQITVSSPDADERLALFGLSLDRLPGTPTVLVAAPNGVVMGQITGFKTAADLAEILRGTIVSLGKSAR